MGGDNDESGDKLKMVEKVGKHKYKINKGFVANMNVPAFFYSNPPLADLMFNEYRPGMRVSSSSCALQTGLDKTYSRR